MKNLSEKLPLSTKVDREGKNNDEKNIFNRRKQQNGRSQQKGGILFERRNRILCIRRQQKGGIVFIWRKIPKKYQNTTNTTRLRVQRTYFLHIMNLQYMFVFVCFCINTLYIIYIFLNNNFFYLRMTRRNFIKEHLSVYIQGWYWWYWWYFRAFQQKKNKIPPFERKFFIYRGFLIKYKTEEA